MALLDLPTTKPITRGDYERIRFQVGQKEAPELAQDLTGWHIRFGAKEFLEADVLLIEKDSDVAGDIDIPDPTTGEGFVVINPEDTEGITYEFMLVCDIQATDPIDRPATTKFLVPIELDVS